VWFAQAHGTGKGETCSSTKVSTLCHASTESPTVWKMSRAASKASSVSRFIPAKKSTPLCHRSRTLELTLTHTWRAVSRHTPTEGKVEKGDEVVFCQQA